MNKVQAVEQAVRSEVQLQTLLAEHNRLRTELSSMVHATKTASCTTSRAETQLCRARLEALETLHEVPRR